jgi:hypothetical protein
MKVVQVLLVGCVLVSALPSSAFAWSCLAVARNGGKGWSYNYGSRDGAIIRALEECGEYGRGCRIVRCNPRG